MTPSMGRRWINGYPQRSVIAVVVTAALGLAATAILVAFVRWLS